MFTRATAIYRLQQLLTSAEFAYKDLAEMEQDPSAMDQLVVVNTYLKQAHKALLEYRFGEDNVDKMGTSRP
jgi:hypothetical protein